MTRIRRLWSLWWPGILFVGVAFLGWVGPWIGILDLWAPPDCSTETKAQIRNLSGLDFDVSETDCDTLAGGTSMSVLVSRHGERAQTLLFKFTPVYSEPVPDIAVDRRRSTILISVPEIEDIYSRRDRWQEMAIKYEIGTIYYPSAGAASDAK